jgi:arginine:pyruvate transaminase
MRFSKIGARLAGLGSEKWAVHVDGRQREALGHDMIFLSIGEPDAAPPKAILDKAYHQMLARRLRYSPGNGEPSVLEALSRHYTKQTGREITSQQFLFLPGTQTALYMAFVSILDEGDEVLLLDPYYATYEGVIRGPGGVPVAVPLDPDNGFHPNLDAIEAAITPRTKALLLNSPSNPTGAVFTKAEIKAIGAMCKKHDLWIVSDEVYATMIYGNNIFTSPFFDKDLEERTIVTSSISKSHALPGFRCGWIAASEEFVKSALSITETMLFGSQPFLQDATALALDTHFPEADAMRHAYEARARVLVDGLKNSRTVSARMPEGGMFVMVDVRKTGVSGEVFARRLLNEHNVVCMPGESFGLCGAGHLRVALTVGKEKIAEAAKRIAALASSIA